MREKDRYLVGLDVLRCLLALSILIFHYYHFSTPFLGKDYADKTQLPFAKGLMLLYTHGGFAVEIFWMISGIIFYHFYLRAISEKGMSFFTFLYLRFSRLYPLHLLTLLSVAVLQYRYLKIFGQTFIFDNNDGLHFILNLFMINFWNAKFGLSFNGPFWSVSAEMFVYIVFFVIALIRAAGSRKNLILLTIAFFVCYCLGIVSPFYECLLYFFAGCLIAVTLPAVRIKHIVLLVAGIAGLLLVKYRSGLLPGNPYIIRSFDCLVKLLISSVIVLLFSKTFVKAPARVTGILREMGNTTYAIYMIHISVEIILVFWFYQRGVAFLNTPVFFCTYMAGVVVLGLLSYRFFEMPVQAFLRSKLKQPARDALPVNKKDA